MRVAFCGKGGSGKSTISSLFARYLAAQKQPVLVVDGDINQHLGEALGFSADEVQNITCLGTERMPLKEYVRGTNPRIESLDHIAETTPAGNGSGLIWFHDETNPVFRTYQIKKDGIRFMSVGGHSEQDVGTTCYHGFSNMFGIFLNHLIDGPGEYVIGDMCAGADPFASCSLATRFDAVFLVVEPTLKSVGVYEQCRTYGDPFGVKIFVIGNKVEDEADEAFIRERVGDALIGCFGNSKFVRNIEKGVHQEISDLEPVHLALLEKIKTITDGLTRDWAKFREVGIHFHRLAAESWGNQYMGIDFMEQIDPDFKIEDFIRQEGENRSAA